MQHTSAKDSVILTGATGFIGRRLQKALLADNRHICALVRPSSANKDQLLPGIHRIQLELSNTDELASALSNSVAVIYCAGSVRGRNLEDFSAANIVGVRSVVEAMNRSCPETPLLLISSLAASRPGVSDYANSKFLGEQEIIQHAKFPWTIFRPPAVYGQGDKEMLPLLKLARKGLAITAGPASQKLSLIHVDDLAAAVLAWLESWPACQGQIFSLDDGHSGGYDWQEIVVTASGGKYHLFRIPKPLLFAAAKANLIMSRLFDYSPMLSPGKARELIQTDWICHNELLVQATGWTPAIDLKSGLKKLFGGTENMDSEK
jgi:nucleoside-diphosphate-sugar epimerase